MNGLPPVHEWAEDALRTPVELLLAGDQLLVAPGRERTIAASVPDCGTQIVTFTTPHDGCRAGAPFRCRWGTYAYRVAVPAP